MKNYEYRLRQVRFLCRHMFGIRPRLLFRQGAKPRLARVSVTFKRRGSPTKPTLPVTLARTVLTMITSSIASRWSGAIGYCKSNNCGLESVGLTKKDWLVDKKLRGSDPDMSLIYHISLSFMPASVFSRHDWSDYERVLLTSLKAIHAAHLHIQTTRATLAGWWAAQGAAQQPGLSSVGRDDANLLKRQERQDSV